MDAQKAALIITRIKAAEDPVPPQLPAKYAAGPTVADLAGRYLEDVAVRCKPKTQRPFSQPWAIPDLRCPTPTTHIRLSDTVSTSARFNIDGHVVSCGARRKGLAKGPVRHQETTEGGRMHTRTCTGLGVLAMLFSLAGSVGAVQQCPKGLEPVTEFRMFFGLADGNGKVVTEDKWQRFLAYTITPRFRAGLTVFDGRGQWLPPSGELQREPVKVVIGALSSDPARGIELADEISRAFASGSTRTRFSAWPRRPARGCIPEESTRRFPADPSGPATIRMPPTPS